MKPSNLGLDRRRFLQGGMVAGAALVQTNSSRGHYDSVKERPDIEDLAEDEDAFEDFLHALNKIKDLPASNANSYAQFSSNNFSNKPFHRLELRPSRVFLC